MRLKNLALNPYLHLALLALIVTLTFSRTLGTYFLADDFGEIAYVSRIAAGDLGMLVANFTGNYMQIPSMSVWRPWLLISLLTDFIIWGANPLGYYLTNLLSYVVVCLNLYLFVRNLTSDWCRTRSSLAAFFAALIFALNPLHCESISWVVGRVDIVCAFFYLTCLNLFVLSMRSDNRNKKKLTILSVVSFWLAMWTKEMAIGAPVLAVAIALLWGRPPLAPKKSLQLCLPLLISTVVYFALRYMALGTLLGGYTQGIGDAQAADALHHWLDPDTARRLFFPFAYSIYGAAPQLQTVLALVYTALTALFLLRLGSLSLPPRWLIFLPLWLATALAPIYKLWGLGYELEGARFVFFATMPLAAFFPIMLLAPHSSGATAKSRNEGLYRKALAGLSIFALIAVASLYGKIAARLNLEWVHAGKEVREFAQQCRQINSQLKSDAILLGIPKRLGGAHMILNGTTFKILLQPPFVKEKVEDRFLTFDPIIFGNSDHINASRFKECLSRPGMTVFVWDEELKCFSNFPAPQKSTPSAGARTIVLSQQAPPHYLHTAGHARFYPSLDTSPAKAVIQNITTGDGIFFGDLNIDPLQVDYAVVKLKNLYGACDSSKSVTLSCSWKDDDHLGKHQVSRNYMSAPAKTETSQEQTVYLRLSSNYRWYTQGKIESLFVGLPQLQRVSVSELSLLPATAVTPQIKLTSASACSAIGVYPTKADETTEVAVTLSPDFFAATGAGAGQKASEIQIEISKANAFFENMTEDKEADALAQKLKKAIAPANTGEYKFTLPLLPKGANYQVRARVLDASGQTIGDVSDPLVLRSQ